MIIQDFYELTNTKPLSEDRCNCLTCQKDENRLFWGMTLCSKCGNKRCPHANDHRNECTNSNESGQKGSAYE
jgi:hypothetical protein